MARAFEPDRIQGYCGAIRMFITARPWKYLCLSQAQPHPNPIKTRAVLGAIKAASRRLRRWPTASLDGACAWRASSTAGRDEETAFGSTMKLEKKGKKDELVQ